MNSVFWLGIMVLTQISRISPLIPHIYVLNCFINFLVIFGYIWIDRIYNNWEFLKLGVVLKLEFEVNGIHTK